MKELAQADTQNEQLDTAPPLGQHDILYSHMLGRLLCWQCREVFLFLSSHVLLCILPQQTICCYHFPGRLHNCFL